MSTDNKPTMPIPGVRYVKRKVTDVEATTLDGETTYREVERTVRVPAPPRDWDMVLVRGLITAAIISTGLSAYWTTDSIGGLLSRTSSASAAYAVAAIFDLAWLHCQAREWLDRRDPERAKVPRRAGYVFLAVTMGAIIAHGAVEHELTSGVVGAVVSVLAKGMWINVLGYYAVPLDKGMAHHLLTRRRRIAVRLALGKERRELAAMEAYERLLYGQAGGDVQVTRYETSAMTPASPVSPQVPPMPLPYVQTIQHAPAPAPTGDTAIPLSPQVPPVPAPSVPPVSAPAGDTTSAAGTGVMAEFNGHHFQVGSEDTPPPGFPDPQATAREHVFKMLGLPLDAPGSEAAPTPAEPTPDARPHLQVVGSQTKTDFIRTAITADPAITLDELTDKVRDAFGDKKDLRKDVRRLRSRIEGKAS